MRSWQHLHQLVQGVPGIEDLNFSIQALATFAKTWEEMEPIALTRLKGFILKPQLATWFKP